jgi:hypothetical protein
MKKLLATLTLLSGTAFGATYVGSISNVWPSYATIPYVDGVAAGLHGNHHKRC